MALIVDFNEALRKDQLTELENRMGLWFDLNAPCMIGVFSVPSPDIIKHPNFRQRYLDAIAFQISQIVGQIDLTKISHISKPEPDGTIFTFFKPYMDASEALKIKGLIEEMLSHTLRNNELKVYETSLLKKCFLFLSKIFKRNAK